MIEVIGFDGDDTLWHSEDQFAVTQEHFKELLLPYVDPGLDLDAALAATEHRNLDLFGYGVKGFTLSMIETAIEVTLGRVPAATLQVLIDFGRELLSRPVELLEGVAETIEQLSRRHRLLCITKGDLLHQESKMAGSGLGEFFTHVEIVSEKDQRTYRRILQRHEVEPERFLMVGNSVRSDVLPVLAIGARAVHVPYHVTWIHEHAETAVEVPTIGRISELPAWMATLRS